MVRVRWAFLAGLALLACGHAGSGGTTDVFPIAPHAAEVEVGVGNPPPGSVALGPLEIWDGSGCGAFGTSGSYNVAMLRLRNAASYLGANYVTVVSSGPDTS